MGKKNFWGGGFWLDFFGVMWYIYVVSVTNKIIVLCRRCEKMDAIG